jgi:hypothetical protein
MTIIVCLTMLTPDERKVKQILDEWDLSRLEQDRQDNDMTGWDESYPGQGAKWTLRRPKETR